ncbi:MAG: TrmB family transcriptional regulator [Candidatus Magasanikbacteria bacterium]|jgi:HTH-type transcriptional regulator, sugar sensing transcriptional regulator|nr:TrmB family transcriptional regulator [Candidatus Magasanikbacteria bacterium]
MDISTLKQLGLTEKGAHVYMKLLQKGPSSVRQLSGAAGINRGSTYDVLKQLQQLELVDYYKKDSKQHFVAASPRRLMDLHQTKQAQFQQIASTLEASLPELEALHHNGGAGPVARYVGAKELHTILEDVLATCAAHDEQSYRIYSVEGLRKQLYTQFPTFSDVRIAKGISVKAIAIGKGGKLRGLDERKWLAADAAPKVDVPTYIIMYPGKTAYISLDDHNEPMGVVIDNAGVYATQRYIFDALWKTL